MVRRRTAGGLGETVVVVDHRARLEGAVLITRRLKAIGQHPAATVTPETDAPRATAQPGGQAGAKGVREQNGQVDLLAAQLPGERRPAIRPGTLAIKKRMSIE